MMDIDFEGWWQCRFATDPDPSDDPRGVSGPTFTTAGEPAFDRVIRFQSPVSPRWPFTDAVGVTVVASLGGLIAAFWLDISPGGAVVLTQGLAFGLALLFGPRRGLVNRWARGRSTRARRHAVDSR